MQVHEWPCSKDFGFPAEIVPNLILLHYSMINCELGIQFYPFTHLNGVMIQDPADETKYLQPILLLIRLVLYSLNYITFS